MADELTTDTGNSGQISKPNLEPPVGVVSKTDPQEMKQIEEMVTRFNFALSSTLLYPAGHPVVKDALEKTYQILNTLLNEKSGLTFYFKDEEILYQGEFILESSFLARSLSGVFHDREIGSVTFLSGLKSDELLALTYSFYQTTPVKVTNLETLTSVIEKKNVVHIQFGKPVHTGTQQEGPKFNFARKIYEYGSEIMEAVALSASTRQVVDVGEVRPIVQNLIDNLMDDQSSLLAMSSIRSFDKYLYTHSMNVCILSLSLALYMDISRNRLMEIGIGALLHDIGKVLVPQDILHKPDNLIEEEWAVIRKHPVEGMKMILRSRYAMGLPALIIYGHHWKYGSESGYPEIRRKCKKNPYISLVTICDCYDAMTTRRPYKRAYLPGEALIILEQMSGTHLDPQLVYFFKKMMGPYPIGTLVKVNTGEIGVVFEKNPEIPERPQIRVILDSAGTKVDDIILKDLSEIEDPSQGYLNSITEILHPDKVSFNPLDYF